MIALKMIDFNNIINLIKKLNLCYGVHHDNQPIQEFKFHQLNEFSHWDELHYCNGNLEGDEFTQVIYFIKSM